MTSTAETWLSDAPPQGNAAQAEYLKDIAVGVAGASAPSPGLSPAPKKLLSRTAGEGWVRLS